MRVTNSYKLFKRTNGKQPTKSREERILSLDFLTSQSRGYVTTDETVALSPAYRDDNAQPPPDKLYLRIYLRQSFAGCARRSLFDTYSLQCSSKKLTGWCLGVVIRIGVSEEIRNLLQFSGKRDCMHWNINVYSMYTAWARVDFYPITRQVFSTKNINTPQNETIQFLKLIVFTSTEQSEVITKLPFLVCHVWHIRNVAIKHDHLRFR